MVVISGTYNQCTVPEITTILQDVIFYLHGSEMYRLYGSKLYGPVMVKLYKENDVLLKRNG